MNSWTIDELRLAMALYCQLPFGKLHRGNPDIIALASKIGRTPSAVAMKLVNFASLDPEIRESGRKGLGNASARDREAWDRFRGDWNGELIEATKTIGLVNLERMPNEQIIPEGPTTRRAVVTVRTKQHIFRQMILSGFCSTCCMSGLKIPKLLVASHIVDWKVKVDARLNPHNGLCLSALHDKAYDSGYLTVGADYRIKVSKEIAAIDGGDLAKKALIGLADKEIRMPERFLPSREFLAWHSAYKYVDSTKYTTSPPTF